MMVGRAVNGLVMPALFLENQVAAIPARIPFPSLKIGRDGHIDAASDFGD
jgi:hypothetical protein